MNLKTAVLIACFVCDTTLAESDLPADVQLFMRNADACEHFAGEFDGGLSEQRQREIEQSVVKYCQSAQQQLRQLKEKYKRAPQVMKIIRRHANDAVTSFR